MCQQRDDRRPSDTRKQKAEHAGDHREQHAFDQHLLDQPRSTGANREPQRHLVCPSGRTREIQIRHVETEMSRRAQQGP